MAYNFTFSAVMLNYVGPIYSYIALSNKVYFNNTILNTFY